MLQIAKTDEYDLWLAHQMSRPFSFVTPFGGEDFALLLVIAEPGVPNDERHAVTDKIVRLGCRYACCAGHQCSEWHDCIDYSYLYSDPGFSPPDEKFIMTTWHEDESLEDVAFFFRMCTSIDGVVPRHFLVVILGGDAESAFEVRSTVEESFRTLA